MRSRDGIKILGGWMRLLLGMAALGSAFLVIAASPAAAEASSSHLFDAVHSLEGDCVGEDGVKDPGCPYLPPPDGPRTFAAPCGVASDSHGTIYVANPMQGTTQGRIDVFDPAGKFLTEISNAAEPCQLAVDSTGVLYTVERKRDATGGGQRQFIARYQPDEYPPAQDVTYTPAGKLEFILQEPEKSIEECAQPLSIAVDPSTDHLYVANPCGVGEYGAAAEGNPLLKCCIGEESIAGEARLGTSGVDVYGRNHDVYVTVQLNEIPRVLIFDGATGEEKCDLQGSGLAPTPKFDFGTGGAIGIDQSTGALYVRDLRNGVIDQFVLDDGGGEACPSYSFAQILPPPHPTAPAEELYADLAVDAPCRTGFELGESCNVGGKYNSPNVGEVYTTWGTNPSNSHLYAFKLKEGGPPEVKSQVTAGVTQSEAVLEAEMNSNGLETTYHFEYVRQKAFEEGGYSAASVAPIPDAEAGEGGDFGPVAVPIAELQADTAYRFRLVASNCEAEEANPEECLTLGEGVPGDEGEDASFHTYPQSPVSPPCVNEDLRNGVSEGLPDCRAYELVTPSDTNGRTPTMVMLGEGSGGAFATQMSSPDGNSLMFGSDSGSLPGVGGGGYRDTFEALRDPAAGWTSRFSGLTSAQSVRPAPGGISPDHGYSFWTAEGAGTLHEEGGGGLPNYLRVPAGTEASPNCSAPGEPEGGVEWIGCGSLGNERQAQGKWISGEHVIFTANLGESGRLEPCAPTKFGAIYDRTPGGETHCISLLPGDETPEENPSLYRGVSADGTAVAFTIASTLYVRRDNSQTLEVAEGNPTFAGLSADGAWAFYLSGGNVFACNLDQGGCAGEGAHEPIAVGAGGDSTLVNISADGSHVYFVSGTVLSGEEENGYGVKAAPGAENLYVWDQGEVRFIAAVSLLDVEGEPGNGGQGLGLWLSDVLSDTQSTLRGPALDASRSNPDGAVFVFQSHEDLTGQDSGDHTAIYRFDAEAAAPTRLRCLSCNPTEAVGASDARLLSKPLGIQTKPLPPLNSLASVANVAVDGKKVFFQSSDSLVPADLDGRQDVYEWEAEGAGGCEREAGCLSLISYGRSAEDDYFYAVSPDGHDVFFVSGDLLTWQDRDGTPSVYDAREEGGIAQSPPPPSSCLGEACQPAVLPPEDPTPATAGEKPGDPHPGKKRPCPRGKVRAKPSGKGRCGKRHGKKRHVQRGTGRHGNGGGR